MIAQELPSRRVGLPGAFLGRGGYAPSQRDRIAQAGWQRTDRHARRILYLGGDDRGSANASNVAISQIQIPSTPTATAARATSWTSRAGRSREYGYAALTVGASGPAQRFTVWGPEAVSVPVPGALVQRLLADA